MSKNKYKTMSMTELVVSSQADDIFAVEELIKRIQKDIWATFYYLDSKKNNHVDLTQETLLKIIKNIKSLKNPVAFKSWVLHIARNIFYDDLKKKERFEKFYAKFSRNIYENHITNEISDLSQKPEDEILANELDFQIKKSISKLDNDDKELIILRDLHGLSYAEIAELTATNIGTVKSKISRARSKLQKYLKSYVA